MEELVCWNVIGEILEMGKFIAAVGSAGSSANIVGKLKVGRDGPETVIEKELCHCHIHVCADRVKTFFFTYRDIGLGPEACCEALGAEGEVIFRLYYIGKNAGERYQDFISRNRDKVDAVTGSW